LISDDTWKHLSFQPVSDPSVLN